MKMLTRKTSGIGGAATLVAALLIAGCTDSPAPGTPAQDRIPTATAPSTIAGTQASTPSAGPDDIELGPNAVRVLTSSARAGKLSFEVTGPVGATYGYRDSDGKLGRCRQEEKAGTPSVPPPGVPPELSRQVLVSCEGAGGLSRESRLLVRVKLESFSYDFEVPATAR